MTSTTGAGTSLEVVEVEGVGEGVKVKGEVESPAMTGDDEVRRPTKVTAQEQYQWHHKDSVR